MLDNSHGNKATFLATPEARDLDVPPRCRFGALRQELAKGAACRGSGGGPQGGFPQGPRGWCLRKLWKVGYNHLRMTGAPPL